MNKSVMIVGVGGQGTLLASRILGDAMMSQGYDVKVSEVHGMSQRGGSVVTYVRYGDKVYSPIIETGEADILLSFEQLEAARFLPYLKEGGTVVSAPNERVRGIIEKAAADMGAVLTVCDKAGRKPGKFVYKTWSYHLALKGTYQAENASVALETVRALREKGWKIPEKAVTDGFENVSWKARFEFVAPNIVIDGGHNIDGIRALKSSLAEENRPVTLVLAMMKDKSYELCIHTIAPAAKTVVATELDMERALGCDEIKRICDSAGTECIAEPDPERAIDKAIELAGKGLVCICGSLYLAGEAERILKDKGIFNF